MSLSRKPTFLDQQLPSTQATNLNTTSSVATILSRMTAFNPARLSPYALFVVLSTLMAKVKASPPASSTMAVYDPANGAHLQLSLLTNRFTLTDLTGAVQTYCPAFTQNDLVVALGTRHASYCQDNPAVDTLELSIEAGKELSHYAADCLTQVTDSLCRGDTYHQHNDVDSTALLIAIGVIAGLLLLCVGAYCCVKACQRSDWRSRRQVEDNYDAMAVEPPSYSSSAASSSAPQVVLSSSLPPPSAPSFPVVIKDPVPSVVIIRDHHDHHHSHYHDSHNPPVTSSAGRASGWRAPAPSAPFATTHSSGWRAAPQSSAPVVVVKDSSHTTTSTLPSQGRSSGWH
jgi:hypothetical protein